MGKYKSEDLGYQMQKAQEEISLLIANELAEANRLKRIELLILKGSSSGTFNSFETLFIKTLNEDRA